MKNKKTKIFNLNTWRLLKDFLLFSALSFVALYLIFAVLLLKTPLGEVSVIAKASRYAPVPAVLYDGACMNYFDFYAVKKRSAKLSENEFHNLIGEIVLESKIMREEFEFGNFKTKKQNLNFYILVN